MPIRKPKQETPLTALIRITYYLGHCNRVCTLRSVSQSAVTSGWNRSLQRQENLFGLQLKLLINQRAELRPDTSPFSKKRHLQHPVCIRTFWKSSLISSFQYHLGGHCWRIWAGSFLVLKNASHIAYYSKLSSYLGYVKHKKTLCVYWKKNNTNVLTTERKHAGEISLSFSALLLYGLLRLTVCTCAIRSLAFFIWPKWNLHNTEELGIAGISHKSLDTHFKESCCLVWNPSFQWGPVAACNPSTRPSQVQTWGQQSRQICLHW